MKKIFLVDLDGVCVRWIEAACVALGIPVLTVWPKGAKGFAEAVGLTPAEVYGKLDPLGSKFWRDLEEFPWFWDLHKRLAALGKVVFCTSPSCDSNATKGKVEWIQDRFGKFNRNYILTNLKYLCASPNAILIDDTVEQCKNFRNNGGEAILFPAMSNSLANIKDEDKVKYVLDTIKFKG